MLLNEEIIQPSQYRNNSSIYTLEFGPAVREIGEYAFANCTNLEEIKVPGSVVIIKKGAFEKCPKLHKIIFNNGTMFETGVFLDCFNLEELIIGKMTARVFSLDSSHSYIISLLDPQLSTDEYSVYVGRYAIGDSHFPIEPSNQEQPPLYVVTINKNGKEYKWFHSDLNIAILATRFLASGKTFEQYFGIELTEQTEISYEQFGLLVGACYAGWGIWSFFCTTIGVDPNNSYRIDGLLQAFGDYVPVLSTRLKTMIARKNEVFSYLDMKNLIPYKDMTRQAWNWAMSYTRQGKV